jgi:hypothetical protein
MSVVTRRRVLTGALCASMLVPASAAMAMTPVAAGTGGPGSSGGAPGRAMPPTGSTGLTFMGTTGPGQARGRSDTPGSRKPFFAHGGKNPPPSSSSGTSAVSVAALAVPGPGGSSSGMSASTTSVFDSLDTQVAALGSDQSLEPPDNGLATGNGYVVELVNDSGWIWQSSGGSSITPWSGNPFDLNKFFYVPSGYSASDPRLVYDPVGQVWIATAVAFSQTGSSYLDMDVSGTSDPEGGWSVYALQGASDLYDQPKLGVSGSQIVVSANDFLAGSLFQGAITWVFDRAGVESGSFLQATVFGPDSSEFSVVPASVVAGSVEYAVWNDADCSYSGCSTGSPTLGVIELAGSPETNSVTATVYNPSMSATSNPPAATQPSPGKALATDDDRYLGATWLPGGVIWTAGNDACTPPGDTSVRPCMRFDEVSVSGTPTVLQDFDAGAKGAAVMYPAIAADSAGDLGVVYSASSSTEPVSVGTAGRAAGAALDSLSTGPWLETGAGPYVDGTSQPRWGDYSGAAAMGSGIWVAGEYAAQSGTADWGVAGALLAFGAGGGPAPNSIAVSAVPSQLKANSATTSSITATVSDSSGPVSGDTVSFSTSGACGPLSAPSAVTDAGGVASVDYTAASAGTCTITATDSSGGAGSASVKQVSDTIVASANPTKLAAGSGKTSQVTATVTYNSAVVSGDTVTFIASGTCGTLSAPTAVTNSSGVASVTYTASKSTGVCTMTVTDSSGGSGSTSVSQVRAHK